MSGCYLDASAIVKLATQEAESGALRAFLAESSHRASSRVAQIEVIRALARRGEASLRVGGPAVDQAFAGVLIIELDETIALAAARLAPPSLRSLDAIHLASALSLQNELDAVVTYDHRLAEAARGVGLSVVAPG